MPEVATPTRMEFVSTLRVRARVDHDCPHCGAKATKFCVGDYSLAESAIVHDDRLDLAFRAALDRARASARRQALVEVRVFLDGMGAQS